jgi:hypothetical protein
VSSFEEVTERDKSECDQARQYGLQESDKALFGMRSSIICLWPDFDKSERDKPECDQTTTKMGLKSGATLR